MSMAQTCIICLGELRTVEEATAGDEHAARQLDDDEAIAHLLPCNHDMHNSCLQPWVERANSCPICRSTFNMVQLAFSVGGEVIDSYGVQDKTQSAEADSAEYDPVLEEACELCGTWDAISEMVSCDVCQYTLHMACAGLASQETPDSWVCPDCTVRPGSATWHQRNTRARLERSDDQSWRRSAEARNRTDGTWARIWLGVSRQLDLDLDFPYDTDEDLSVQRTPAQRREFSRWQRRFQVAERQGNSQRFHELATRLQTRQALAEPEPEPESQDVLRAWNAFEKARESQEAPSSVRRKRRRSHDSTPGPQAVDQPEPQLKRPRLRVVPSRERATALNEQASAAQHAEPTFLSSLLKDVEQHGVTAAASPEQLASAHHSPRQSPARSPSSSPKSLDTPGPQYNRSPPLSSTIAPPISPTGLTFSPIATTTNRRHSDHTLEQQRQSRPRHSTGTHASRKDSSSPGAKLSFSSKEEIQRMVKRAIGSRYRDGEITKEQYTDVNRDVSRRMYDTVGSTLQLWTGNARAKWQAMADTEVNLAIDQLQMTSNTGGTDGTPRASEGELEAL